MAFRQTINEMVDAMNHTDIMSEAFTTHIEATIKEKMKDQREAMLKLVNDEFDGIAKQAALAFRGSLKQTLRSHDPYLIGEEIAVYLSVNGDKFNKLKTKSVVVEVLDD